MRNLEKEIEEKSNQIKNQALTIAGTPLYEDRQTTGEKRLVDVIRNSFFDYWTIPNPFKKKGQELCDLLVVFDNNIIIISDKCKDNVNIIDDEDLKKIWSSNVKKYTKSVNQLIEAKEWISENPLEIYFDSNCKEKIPQLLEINENTKFILIAVTSGWSEIYKKLDYKNLNLKEIKCFGIDTSIDRKADVFKIKNSIKKNNDFIHSFEDVGFKLLIDEISNIREIINYLIEREDFFKKCENNNIVVKSEAGEEALLGQYLDSLYNQKEINKFFKHSKLPKNKKYFFNKNLLKNKKKEETYKKDLKFLKKRNILRNLINVLLNLPNENFKYRFEKEIERKEILTILCNLRKIEEIQIGENINALIKHAEEKGNKRFFSKFLSLRVFSSKVNDYLNVFLYLDNPIDFTGSSHEELDERRLKLLKSGIEKYLNKNIIEGMDGNIFSMSNINWRVSYNYKISETHENYREIEENYNIMKNRIGKSKYILAIALDTPCSQRSESITFSVFLTKDFIKK